MSILFFKIIIKLKNMIKISNKMLFKFYIYIYVYMYIYIYVYIYMYVYKLKFHFKVYLIWYGRVCGLFSPIH